MSDLDAIADKVSSLIRLLASDNDGEVVACARALRRVLKSSGSDLHALATRLTQPQRSSGPSAVEMLRQLHQRYEAGKLVGKSEGKVEGFREGKATGYTAGYAAGHAAGKADGLREQEARKHRDNSKQQPVNEFDDSDPPWGNGSYTEVDQPKRGSRVGSAKLINAINLMREHCTYSARSDEFLDDLIERANKFDPVFFSEKQQSWFEDLMRQAKRRGAPL